VCDVLTLVVIHALVAYRLTRFILLDSLLEQTRAKLKMWLASRGTLVGTKLFDLFDCPYCVSVWAAGVATIFYHPGLGWRESLVVWLAAAGGAMVAWRAVE
jgi:hypothetical protein